MDPLIDMFDAPIIYMDAHTNMTNRKRKILGAVRAPVGAGTVGPSLWVDLWLVRLCCGSGASRRRGLRWFQRFQ